jgi:hypothetical protein
VATGVEEGAAAQLLSVTGSWQFPQVRRETMSKPRVKKLLTTCLEKSLLAIQLALPLMIPKGNTIYTVNESQPRQLKIYDHFSLFIKNRNPLGSEGSDD